MWYTKYYFYITKYVTVTLALRKHFQKQEDKLLIKVFRVTPDICSSENAQHKRRSFLSSEIRLTEKISQV